MKLIPVFQSIIPSEAYLVKSMLDHAKIPCQIWDDNISTFAHHLSLAVGGIKIVVRPEDVEESKAIINEYYKNKSDNDAEEN